MIEKGTSPKEIAKIISLRDLSKASGVPYSRLYDNLRGFIGTLTPNEKTVLANTIFERSIDLYKFLGYKCEKITKIKT